MLVKSSRRCKNIKCCNGKKKKEQQGPAYHSNVTGFQKLIITRIVAHPLFVHLHLGSNNAHWRMLCLILNTGNLYISEIAFIRKEFYVCDSGLLWLT